MDKPKAYCRLFLPSFLLLSACTVDISQPDPSATAVDAEAKTWAVKFQHQSSFTEQSIKEITAPDLKPGDLLFFPGHVAMYIGNGRIVHASSAKTGIKYGYATYREILAVRRII